MAVNYSKQLPQDRNNAVMTSSPPPYAALATTVRDDATLSSVSALNANTTVIEVAAVGAPAAIRWSMQTNLTASSSVITAAGSPAFDNFIPTGVTRLLVVPRNSQALPNYNSQGFPSVVGLNTAEGLFSGIATKSAGTGSVLLTQY